MLNRFWIRSFALLIVAQNNKRRFHLFLFFTFHHCCQSFPFKFDLSFIPSWSFIVADVVDVTRFSLHWCYWSIIKKSLNTGAMTMMMIDHPAVGEIVMITRIRIHLPAKLKAKILNDCCKFWYWITQLSNQLITHNYFNQRLKNPTLWIDLKLIRSKKKNKENHCS